MKLSNQLQEIIKHANSSTGTVATMTDQSHSNLLNKLSRDNLRISEISEILTALGYHDITISARDNNETVIIHNDKVEYRPHTKYMVFDENQSLIDDIRENGFRDRQFKDIVFEIFEPVLKPKFGDLWETYVPKEFEDGFKNVIGQQLSIDDFVKQMGIKSTNHQED